MQAPALRLTRITKCFHRYARPREVIRTLLARTGLRFSAQAFWALKGINFELARGQTLGIVGRNGSGKSTLLQIIAGTLAPTSGRAEVFGQVAALLELGSGFHREFTGRENVYFQGQLQGCSRALIEERFASIVEFASIGDFLDQPVKTYSSGMLLRLAFAVTIALDPDILIVDEALAVGDEAFQRKCFARIRELRDSGCTILMVSHSGQHIIDLCDRAMLLDVGEQLLLGPPKDVISRYHKLLFAPPQRIEALREEFRRNALDREPAAQPPPPATPRDDFDPNLRPQSTVVYPARGARISEPRITRLDGTTVNVLLRGQPYRYCFRAHFDQNCRDVRFGMMLKTVTGFELGGGVSHTRDQAIPDVQADDVFDVTFEFRCMLRPGVYFANAGITALEDGAEVFLHRLIDAVMFRVQPESAARVTGIVDFAIESSVSQVACGSAAALGRDP